MKHIAIYVRVFSKRQDTASQKPDLERWAAAQRQEVTWYSDKFTGKTMDRPGWNRLMRQVEAGKVSAIVVWRLDRLGRTAKGLTALFQELFEQKVNLVSLRDGIDLNTPAGRLMAKMLASVARYETEVRAERVLAGQAKARADGKRGGWHLRSRAEVVADSPGICGSERRFVRASVRISGRNRRIRPENGQMGRAVFSPCDDVDAITGTCSLPRARGEREERPSIRTNASNTLVDCVLDRVSGRSPSSSRCNSDLAFDPVSGMLYASHGPQLYIVDKATAQPTFVGSTTSTLSTPATRWTPCASSSMTSARTDRTHRPRRGRHGTWTIPAWRRDGGGQGRREVSFHA